MMDTEENDDSFILRGEQYSIMLYMRYRNSFPPTIGARRRKNASDSIAYRKKGNELYSSEFHNEEIHQKILRFYSQCIALAPNNSEELALGHGNRSALLYHLKKFKDCIKDCDRGCEITSSKLLKAKLLCRKADCLMHLKDLSMKSVCRQALQLLGEVKLEKSAEKKYLEKLNNMMKIQETPKMKDSKNKKNFNIEKLSNFPRLKEAPCASDAVAIEYNREWGRHLIATKNIKAGDIISINQNYHTYISEAGMYLYCSNCATLAWAAMPCENCIYDVYCSEICRSEAWEKFHQWECPIYPYIWDIDKNINAQQFAMKLMFTALHEVGGLDQMKKIIIDIENCSDPRSKGFFNNTFDCNTARSVYSLMNLIDHADPFLKYSLAEQTCIGINLLAKHTTFFGTKLILKPSELFLNKDVLFAAALLLHTRYICNANSSHLCQHGKSEPIQVLQVMNSFASLMNHSCDPNVLMMNTANKKRIICARKPIEKGSQLFTCYGDDFLGSTKEDRENYLENIYGFKCKCLACTEEWSNICLPTFIEIIETTPSFNATILRIHCRMKELMKAIDERIQKESSDDLETFVYKPKFLSDIRHYLEAIASKVTTYCADYRNAEHFLESLLYEIFGELMTTLPKECFKD